MDWGYKSLNIFSKPVELDKEHMGLKDYEVYISDGHGLTLTYFIARSIWKPMYLAS